MKENMTKMKDKVLPFIKENPFLLATAGFGIVALTIILIAIFVLEEFVVSVCILIIIEAAMAALLHNAEMWKHGILLVAQLVAAVIIDRLPLVILCIVAYVVATVALQFMAKEK